MNYLLTILGSALLVIAVAAPIVTQAQDAVSPFAGSTASSTMDPRVERFQRIVQSEIDRRLNALNVSNSRLQNTPKLALEEKGLLSKRVQDVQRDLLAARASTLAASDLAALMSIVESLKGTYADYLLSLRQANLLVSAERIRRAAQDGFIVLEKMKSGAVTPSGAPENSALVTASEMLSSALAEADAVVASVSTLDPKSDRFSSDLAAHVAHIKDGASRLDQARSALQSVLSPSTSSDKVKE